MDVTLGPYHTLTIIMLFRSSIRVCTNHCMLEINKTFAAEHNVTSNTKQTRRNKYKFDQVI